MAQYGPDFQRIVVSLFEHDVYFQSIGSRLASITKPVQKSKAAFEYLRALRYELDVLNRMDLVQTCTVENRDYLLSYLPELNGRVSADLRAGIDVASYTFKEENREPSTVLFLGSFRHTPNVEALNWFLKHVMPLLVALHPGVRLIVAGSDPPPAYTLPYQGPEIEMLGFVPDVREPLNRYSVFVCPILSGSGVRVKLLEAFSSGIPAVSTSLGAEGLSTVDGEICAIADEPQTFASAIARLLKDPVEARQLARRARHYVTEHRDIRSMTERLVSVYQQARRRNADHPIL